MNRAGLRRSYARYYSEQARTRLRTPRATMFSLPPIRCYVILLQILLLTPDDAGCMIIDSDVDGAADVSIIYADFIAYFLHAAAAISLFCRRCYADAACCRFTPPRAAIAAPQPLMLACLYDDAVYAAAAAAISPDACCVHCCLRISRCRRCRYDMLMLRHTAVYAALMTLLRHA